jgi:hypothetical protein
MVVEIHLHCPRCGSHFSAPADAPASVVLDRMTDEAPWFALAEGETFRDMVCAALAARGKILCPDCRGKVLVGEQAPERPASESAPRPVPCKEGQARPPEGP